MIPKQGEATLGQWPEVLACLSVFKDGKIIHPMIEWKLFDPDNLEHKKLIIQYFNEGNFGISTGCPVHDERVQVGDFGDRFFKCPCGYEHAWQKGQNKFK